MKKFNFIRSKFQQGGLPIDPLLQSSLDWYRQWYEQRKKLPQFKFTAESRLGILDRSPNVVLKPFEELNKYDAVAMYQHVPRQRGDLTSRDIIYAADPASVPGFQEAYEKRKGIKLGERISTDLGTNPSVMMHELSHWFDSREPQTMWKPREAKGEPEYQKYPKFYFNFKNSGLDKDQYKWIGSNQKTVGNSTLKTEFNAVLNELRQQEGLKGDQPTTPEQMGVIIQKYMNLPADKLQKTNPEGTRNQRIQTLIKYLQQDPAKLSEFNNTIVKGYNPQNSIFIGKDGGLLKYNKRSGAIPKAEDGMQMGGCPPGQFLVNGRCVDMPTPGTILTYKKNPEWFDNRARYNDNEKWDALIRRAVYSGGYGYDPNTGALYFLNKGDRTVVPAATQAMSKDKRTWTEQDKKVIKKQISKEKAKEEVAKSMQQVFKNPITYVPGAVGAALVAGPAAAAGLGSALSAPLTIGSTVYPSVTAGNLLAAYGVSDFLLNRAPQIPGQIGRGQYGDALANTALGTLDLMGVGAINPNVINNAARLANQGRQYLANTYRNIAEGDNIFNYAWRSPAAGITDDVASRMYQQTRNSVPLDESAKDIIAEYQHTSGPFTGRFESGNINLAKRIELEDAIAQRNLVTQSGKPNVFVRRFDPNNSELYSLDESGRFILNRPTSWSVGRGFNYTSKPNRIVFKLPSGSRGMLNEYNSAKFNQDVSKLMDEREAILGSGLNLGKRLGKVKNEFGGYDYIHKFRGYNPTEYDDIRRLNTENIGEIVNLNQNLATSGGFNVGVYPFLKNPNIVLKLATMGESGMVNPNNNLFTGLPKIARDMSPSMWGINKFPAKEIDLSGLTAQQIGRNTSKPIPNNILGTVMQRTNAKNLSDVSFDELANLQPWVYRNAAQNVNELIRKGVAIDFYGNNMLLDKFENAVPRFSFIDLGTLPKSNTGVFPVGPLYALDSKALDQGIRMLDLEALKSIFKQKTRNALYDAVAKSGIGSYSDKQIYDAIKKSEASIDEGLSLKKLLSLNNKKKGGPIVNSRGFIDGAPPAGSNWRIPGNTLYNPTPFKIRAVGSNGVEKTLNPFDTKRVSFGDAEYVDEYKMQSGGSLPTYQGSEGPGIIPVFKSERDRRKYQNELRRIGQDISRLQKKDRRKLGTQGDDFEFYFPLNTGPRTFSKEYSKKFYIDNPYNSSNCINGVCGLELASGLKFSNPTDGDRYLGNPKFLDNVIAGKEDFYIYEGDNIEPGDHIVYLSPWGTPFHSKIVYDKNRKGDKVNILDNSGGPIFKAINDYDARDIINNRNNGQILIIRPGRTLDKKDQALRLSENKWAYTPEAEKDLLSTYENYHGAQLEKKRSLPYKYSLNPEGPLAQTGNQDLKGVKEFLQFANDEQNINNLIDQLYKLGRPELANKDMIHRSLLNVFGILGQENKWQDRLFGGSKLGLENTIEHVFNPASMSIGPGQIKFNTIGKEFKDAFGIEKPKDLRDWKKIIPLMTAIDLTNQAWMLKQGDKFSERIIGEPGLAADQMKWDVATMSPYFYQGYGYKNIKKGLNQEFDDMVYGDLGNYWSWKNPTRILEKSKDRLSTLINYGEWNPNSFTFGLNSEGFNKAAQDNYSNNIRSRQKVFDPGSYGRNVWENWANNIIRYAGTGNQENVPSASQEAVIFPGATTEGERRQALLKYYESLYGPVKGLLNKKYGGSLPKAQVGKYITGFHNNLVLPAVNTALGYFQQSKPAQKLVTPVNQQRPINYGMDDYYSLYTKYDDEASAVRRENDKVIRNVESDARIPLTLGRFRGANVSQNLIKNTVNAAKQYGVDPWLLVSLIGRESTFGEGQAANKARARSYENLVSGWNIAEDYEPYDPLRYLADRRAPGVAVKKTTHGWNYNVTDQKALNDYLKKNVGIYQKYADKLEKTPKLGNLNSLQLAARFLKSHKVGDYNPGDPNYTRMVYEDMKLLKSDPKMKEYMKSLGYKMGGLTANKAREILHHGEVGGRKLTDKQRRFFGAMSKGNTKKY